MFTDTLNAEIF